MKSKFARFSRVKEIYKKERERERCQRDGPRVVEWIVNHVFVTLLGAFVDAFVDAFVGEVN